MYWFDIQCNIKKNEITIAYTHVKQQTHSHNLLICMLNCSGWILLLKFYWILDDQNIAAPIFISLLFPDEAICKVWCCCGVWMCKGHLEYIYLYIYCRFILWKKKHRKQVCCVLKRLNILWFLFWKLNYYFMKTYSRHKCCVTKKYSL